MNLETVVRRSTLLAAMLCLAMPWSAGAGEDALYGPSAPAGSAFVRVYNATSEPAVGATIGATVVPSAGPMAGSAFAFLPAGPYEAQIGGAKLPVKLEANRYYTLAFRGGNTQLMVAPAFGNMLKAQVTVYNLMDQSPIKLATADGKATVIETVTPNAVGVREVNAVKVSLAVLDGTTKLIDAQPIALERGKSFSLFVSGSKAQPVAQWVVY